MNMLNAPGNLVIKTRLKKETWPECNRKISGFKYTDSCTACALCLKAFLFMPFASTDVISPTPYSIQICPPIGHHFVNRSKMWADKADSKFICSDLLICLVLSSFTLQLCPGLKHKTHLVWLSIPLVFLCQVAELTWNFRQWKKSESLCMVWEILG